jgi:heme exporter protein B
MTAITADQPATPGAMFAMLQRDLLLAVRHRGELASPVLFFIMVVTLFPMSLGPEVNLLVRVAPGVLCVAALLAALLSLERMFRSDLEDGTLEQLLLSPHPTALLVLAKVLAHWLVTGLPLVLVAPVLGISLHLPSEAVMPLMVALLLATPTLSMVGAIGVALTLALPRGGVLLALLVLPLYVPVLIFAADAVSAAVAGLPVAGPLYLLGALLALALGLAPFAVSAALRISLN